MQKKKWTLRPAQGSRADILDLSNTYQIPPLLAMILNKRGITDPAEFLSPTLSVIHDPYLLRDMRPAVERIVSALKNHERIAVYGDYDVDGITSTASLVRFLQACGGDVFYYIPDRKQEGYGVNSGAIDRISAQGAKLLITVDCGITAVLEVEHAGQVGMDVIITDHHECQAHLPQAVAVINPKRPDCDYPFKLLAGVGVVFKLMQALTDALNLDKDAFFEIYAEIAAIGTIADVMPLLGENRALVTYGLAHLAHSQNYGLRALIRQAGLDAHRLTAGSVSFALAPRINAAGRVGDPKNAVKMLLCDTMTEAADYAAILDEENRARQQEEQEILNQALAMIESRRAFESESVLVLAGSGWHHGIIGIVASKITERFYKPCILISLDEGIGKGSGRSIKGFNLFAALSACGSHLLKFGGHELAAGLTVEEDKIDDFRTAVNAYAASVLTEEDMIPELWIDANLPVEYMNLKTIQKLSVMAPYGMGNPAPIFASAALSVREIRTMSEGKHLRLTLTKGRYLISAVGFSMGEWAEILHPGDLIDIAFNLEINRYRGTERAQILLKDLRFSAQ